MALNMSTADSSETKGLTTATKLGDNNLHSSSKHALESTTKNTNYGFELQQRLRQNMSLVPTVGDDFATGPGKSVAFYVMNPRDLKEDYPVWHYFYLITLIFTAFVALFVGPVVFGMLAALGGIGAPVLLSLVGSGVGLFLGVVFGVVFAVVCIVALVRAVGWGAEWVLDTLWYGGSDLLEATRYQVNALVNPQQ